MSAPQDDPIEAYLDELLARLPGSPREVRHALAEIDVHLHALADDGVAAGLSVYEARAEAVRRVGPVAEVVDAPRLLPRLTVQLRQRLALAALLIGAVGGIAVGLAGVFAWISRLLWGDRAIAVPLPVGSYSQADCAGWLSGDPSTTSCTTAMTADHAFDVLRNMAFVAFVGVLAAVAYRILRRRWGIATARPGRLPGIEYVVGAALAAVSSLGCLAVGVNSVLVTRAQGSGADFSLATAAALATCWFLFAGARAVRRACTAPARSL